MKMAWYLGGLSLPLAAIAFVGVGASPLMQNDATSNALQAVVRLGGCDAEEAETIAELVPPVRAGGNEDFGVAHSFTPGIPLALGQPQSLFAVEVLTSDESRLACGQVKSTVSAIGEVAVGLRSAPGSGVTGLAYLAPATTDAALTNLSLFVIEDAALPLTTVPAGDAQTGTPVALRPLGAELRSGRCGQDEGTVIAEFVQTEGGGDFGVDRFFIPGAPVTLTQSVPLLAVEILGNDGAPLACGEVTDVLGTTDEVVVGLRSAPGSGVTGVAYLAPAATDATLTTVALFVVEQEAAPVASMVASPTIPLASPAVSLPEASPVAVRAATPAAVPTSGPSAPYAQTILDTPGLVAYWRLGEVPGEVAANEVPGGYPGSYAEGVTLGGPSALGADDNPSALFSGVDAAYVDMGDVLDFSGKEPFSLEAWIQPLPSTDDYYSIILQKEGADAAGQRNGYVLWHQLATGRIGFERWQNGESDAVSTVEGIANEAWSHVVVTYDGASMRLFLNGVPVSSAEADQALPDTEFALRIGARSTGGSAFNGFIDEVAVYDVALDEDIVADHYRAGANSSGVPDGTAAPTPVSP